MITIDVVYVNFNNDFISFIGISAIRALNTKHSFANVKPLSRATAQSRQKANKCSTLMLPYKQRPKTCSAMAKRMVVNALGYRLESSTAEREIEKRILKEAKGIYCFK